MARKKKSLTKITSFFALLIGLIIGFIGSIYVSLPVSYIIPEKVSSSTQMTNVGEIDTNKIKQENDLSIHFLELGNKYTGDCTLIKVGNTEVLIDAGSKASSIPFIKDYLDKFVEGKLDYVVVTHAHEDHYAGFATNENTDSLFDLYEVDTIIEFSKTNKTTSNKMFANYEREKDEEKQSGAKIYSALECVNETNGAQRNINLGNDIIMQILYHDFYEKTADTENEYSVCLQIINDEQKYLFTGDLEHEGEKSLVEHNKSGKKNENMLGKVELYKAGHHGSKTSSHNELLNIIKPNNICVCCCAGSSEYTIKNEKQFPTQEFINRIYKANPNANIYVTTLCIDYKSNSFESFNGTIVFCSNKNQSSISNTWYFSNNDIELKNTDWFKINRTLPNAS